MAENKIRRHTRQRHVVLEELRKLTSHPTATELYEIARRRLPNISLATVYRNLELLTKIGVVRKLEFGGSEARFDGDLDQHYHVRCIYCGRVDDLHGVSAKLGGYTSRSTNGYDIIGYRLEFDGICPACKKRSAQKHSDDAASKTRHELKMNTRSE
ncbi:MAG: transcriptional repressor [Phycisphaerae bacterium]|nr:transcriptional repressor [Phycisphaerae bacterium]